MLSYDELAEIGRQPVRVTPDTLQKLEDKFLAEVADAGRAGSEVVSAQVVETLAVHEGTSREKEVAVVRARVRDANRVERDLPFPMVFVNMEDGWKLTLKK